jgi:transcription initiation factor TFIIB
LEGTTHTRQRNPNEQDERTTEDAHTDESERVCPECGGRLVEDSAHGETTCAECGLVVSEEAIDHGPEWRAFDSAEKDQ